MTECYYNCNNIRGRMVELKIRKFGNSLGVVLPKELIDRLQTSDGERLFLIESGTAITGSRRTIRGSRRKWRRRKKSWAVIATRCTRWRSETWRRKGKNHSRSKSVMR